MDWKKLIVSIVIVELIGISGSVFTISSIQTWYTGLVKPFFTPPNWIFGPVWTTLFFLIGLSFYFVWEKEKKIDFRKPAFIAFSIQMGLNVLWSGIFFFLKLPFLAFGEIVLLWISIATNIFYFYKIEKKSAYLLIPYLVWVSIATALNYYIVILNP